MMNDLFIKTAITGVILAGGRAQRMGGQDKGLLPLAGEPMVVHAIRLLEPQVAALLINANRNQEVYGTLGYPVISDAVGHFFGPLAGILAAMENIKTPYLLTVPCDSPLLADDYARRMMIALDQKTAEIAVAHDSHRLQPVFALIRADLRESLEHYLGAGERKIDRWYARHRMVVVDFSDRREMFRNINTPEELAALEETLIKDR